MLSDKDWEKFFDLLNKIVDEERPHTEKVKEVKLQAEDNGAEMNLEEFVTWFAE